MKKTIRTSVICGLAMFSLSTSVFAASLVATDAESKKKIELGGDVELDITNLNKNDTGDTFTNGGRIKLSATGTYEGDNYFIKGVAQPLVPFKGDSLSYDDVFLQFGRKAWDVQIGRFEAIDLFPLGKDTVVEHAGILGASAGGGQVVTYQVNDVRGRKSDVVHTALHLKPSERTLLELGVMNSRSPGSTSSTTFKGIRPAMTYQLSKNTVIRAGVESSKKEDAGISTKRNGAGVSAGLKVGNGDVNLNYGHLKQTVTGSNDTTVDSLGANYYNGRVGVGYVHSTNKNGAAAKPKVDTLYATYTMPLFNVKDATVTFAANASKAKNVASDDSLNAVRVRFNYAF